ncbi:hypothetical protein AUJ42_02770 [Candidatus Collierbacteria bacterium CG1_02_44_10]|uniref:PepSY domain-containing protein n=1 Tax=Candidatus Collierbacteria bacterium CG1_02_44_10 TaxID=1805087 RepID=A0A1J4RXL0_9BACT|nr:MAG: hypothetical protein AUJ42_02770 [Candidatus Collierbacteria bacterium CG1_02_44_10]
MPNDDLGQFPTPTSSSPPLADQPSISPTTNQISTEPFSTPPIETSLPIQEPRTNNHELATSAPAFEETPDVIPSIASVPITESPLPPTTTPAPDIQDLPVQQTELTTNNPELSTPHSPSEMPATVVPKGGSSFGAFITIIILLIAGVAIAAAVFLFSQSKQLKQQILEITQTLEKQKTTVTPTPTPTIIEFTTPTPSLESTISATPTPISSISAETALPLTSAPKALKIALNHQPNAQLILIKTENVTSPQTASTKYFFRQDLTTKKYLYVLITNNQEPEIVDKAIYVTPDNNIPSLNDLVLGNTLGIELNEAVGIANSLCLSDLCQTAYVKAQYIKSGDNVIWQLSFTPTDTTKETLIIQLNAQTKAVLYKSAGF